MTISLFLTMDLETSKNLRYCPEDHRNRNGMPKQLGSNEHILRQINSSSPWRTISAHRRNTRVSPMGTQLLQDQETGYSAGD